MSETTIGQSSVNTERLSDRVAPLFGAGHLPLASSLGDGLTSVFAAETVVEIIPVATMPLYA